MAEINTKQLYELINGDYKKVNPLVFLRDILETVSGKDVEFVLTNYNHFNVNWSNTLEETRNQVPEILRRHNFWLSYNDGERQITERFIGDNDEAADTAEWPKDEHWQKIDFELLLTGVRTAVREMFEDFDNYPKVVAVFEQTIKDIFTEFDDYPELKACFIEVIKEIFRTINNYPQLKAAVADTIEDIFENIDNYTQLKNIVINAIKYVFTNINDYTTLKKVIQDEVDKVLSNINSYSGAANALKTLFRNYLTSADPGYPIHVSHLRMSDYLTAGTNITITPRSDGGVTIACGLNTELFKVVQTLPSNPTDDDKTKILVLPNSDPGVATGSYVEYYWNPTLNSFEELGRFGSNIPVVSSLTNGLMSIADKQKLDGIEANAKNTVQYWKRSGTTLSPINNGDNIDTTGVMYHSDIRLKENVKEVSSEDIKDVDKIKFYHYNFIEGDKRERSGVIAQELIKAGFGKYVDNSDKDKFSVDIISILCDKIAYLEQEINILKHGNL